MHYIDGKGLKSELKSNRIYLTIIRRSNCAIRYLWPHGWIHTYPHESDIKKPAPQACGWHVPGLKQCHE